MSALLNEDALVDPPTASLQDDIAAILSGAQTAPSRALCVLIVEVIRKRSHYRSCCRYRDLISTDDLEDLNSEIMLVLLNGTLQAFRGRSQGELICFLRTIVDRHLWRLAQRRIRERELLNTETKALVESWSGTFMTPDQALVAIPESPLPEADTSYLLGLIQAGSQAAYARQQAVSRAAVTQRIKRIRKRVQALGEADQTTVHAWMCQRIQHRMHVQATV
jgi:hypothetical protein